MEEFISLKNVTKRYRMGEVTITAADGVSFSVNKGEFCIVLGQSGAGKTTVLNILGGMDSPTSGLVSVNGKEISRFNKRQLTEYRRERLISRKRFSSQGKKAVAIC